MESYLPILLHLSQPPEINEWLPRVLEQHFHISVATNLLEHPDIHLMNELDDTLKIDQVRTLHEQSTFTPYQLEKSVFIIQKIETASVAAQNALLKILEEPPATLCLILTTFNPSYVLPTIRSRCLVVVDTQLGLPPVSNTGHTSFADIYQQLMSSHHGELVQLADSYSDRSEVQTLLTGLIVHLHQLLTQQVNPLYSTQLAVLLEARGWVEKNANLKLSLTECFFRLHDKQPILRP